MTSSDNLELEPGVRRLVAIANRMDRSDPDKLMPEQRVESAALARRLSSLVIRSPRRAGTQSDVLVPVDGGRITVRIYHPHKPTPGLPLHVFFHGGGWCVGTLDERDGRCRAIAAGAGCVVASVDYRMAPENRYPTAPEDCYAAVCWLVDHSAEFGADPSWLSVSGESAGANLAAVVCLMARDRSGPEIAYQWLDVPATDLTMSQPSIRSTPSGYLLDFERMVEYRDLYLADEGQQTEPYASPLHAEDLSGLPTAWILTCGADPLRDDGRAYVDGLRSAGVAVEHVHLEGHVHPSFAFTRMFRSAAKYETSAVAALRGAVQDRRAMSR